MPPAYPREFREDVIRVARNREPGVRLVVNRLCGLVLVSVGPDLGEFSRGEVAVGGVGSVHVVVDAAILDQDLGLEERVELPEVQSLVA